MKLKLILENIILSEGRVEDAKEKYENIPEEYWDILVNGDPSGNNKYLDWMSKKLKIVLDKSPYNVDSFIEPLNALMDSINYFHNNMGRFEKKDINQYDGIGSFINLVNEIKANPTKSEIKKQSRKLYEDGELLIIIPDSHKSSCYYGGGTKWCTTEKDNDSYFKDHKNDGELYYVIRKNVSEDDDLYKIAFMVHDDNGMVGIYDAPDSPITMRNLESNLPSETLEVIRDTIGNHRLDNGEKGWETILPIEKAMGLMREKGIDFDLSNMDQNQAIHFYFALPKEARTDKLKEQLVDGYGLSNIKFEGGKVYQTMNGWADNDLVSLFKRGDASYGITMGTAEHILSQDMEWEPHGGAVYDWLEQVWGNLTDEHISNIIKHIRKHLIGDEIESEGIDEVVITQELINYWSKNPDELGQEINNRSSNGFDDLYYELQWPYQEAYNDVAQGNHFESATDAIIGVMGKPEWFEVDTRDGGKTQVMKFDVTDIFFDVLYEYFTRWCTDCEENDEGDFMDILNLTMRELEYPEKELYPSVSDYPDTDKVEEQFRETVSNNLNF